jgi:ribonuclease HI
MDGGGRAGSARSEASPLVSSDPYSTIAGGRSTSLHCGNNSCGQQCYCSQARRGRPCIWSAEACLLRQQGTLRIQGTVPGRSEAFIRNSNRIEKAAPFFDEYKITVITDFLLADILHNQDATGRISKWAVELGALSIDFKPRTVIKSQALVDFMTEWRENQVPTPVDKPEHWTMYFDGSLKLNGGGARVLLISPRGEQLKYVLQILWEVSNNEAEYEALLHGLRLAISLGIKRLLAYGDSLLVIQQVNKEWDCNKETVDAYLQEVRKLENKFSGLEVHHVLQEYNVGANILSKLGSTRAQVPPGVFVQELKQPSIKSSPQVSTDAGPQQPDREVMALGDNWREAFVDFIRDQRLPARIDARSAEAGHVMRRIKGFILVDSKLYSAVPGQAFS